MMCDITNATPRTRRALTAALLALSVALCGWSQDTDPMFSKLSKYETPMTYPGVRNYHLSWNLGPTGARGWFYGHRGHSRDSREILIRSVDPGSPAHEVLQAFDIILGIDGRKFDSDARVAFGKAITAAEATTDGVLKLIRWRDGEVKNVEIKLQPLGAYSTSSPHDCPKSRLIFDSACEFLAAQMPPEGFVGMGYGLPAQTNALALLASGKVEYLDHVRQTAMLYGPTDLKLEHNTGKVAWGWGYRAMLLAEYYFATGDETVLPALKEYCRILAEGQGMPGTWGHGICQDHVIRGYGALNSAGIPCYIGLILGRECGLDVEPRALEWSTKFYGSYAGVGSIPYGDHPPGSGATANGKNGMAAVAFHLVGAERASAFFARMCASAASIEGGHTGNFFNVTWSPIGASLTGTSNYANFMRRFRWYHDLCRRWDHSFVSQPWPQTREGDLGAGNYVSRGPMWTTGGYALAYIAPARSLRFLGGRASVFAVRPKALAPVLDNYKRNDYAACRNSLKDFSKHEKLDSRIVAMAEQLDRAAANSIQSIDLTMKSATELIAKGDLYMARARLSPLLQIMPPGDERASEALAGIDTEANAKIFETGKRFYGASRGIDRLGLKANYVFVPRPMSPGRNRGALEHLARDANAGVYQSMAKALLAKHPAHPLPGVRGVGENVLLVDSSVRLKRGEKKPTCRVLPDAAGAPRGWRDPGFDDSSWEESPVPVAGGSSSKTGIKASSCAVRFTFEVDDPSKYAWLVVKSKLVGKAVVYLNGERVLNAPPAKDRPVDTLLKPCTVELLKRNTNVIAVELSGDRSFSFDLGLTAVPRASR